VYYKILGLVQALGMDERLAEMFTETVATHCSGETCGYVTRKPVEIITL